MGHEKLRTNMARPRKSRETAARQRKFYCDDQTWQLLQLNAKLSGKTLSAYLRDASSLQPRSRILAPDQLLILAHMADRLADFANALAHSSLPNEDVLKILSRVEAMEDKMANLVPRYSPRTGHAEQEKK